MQLTCKTKKAKRHTSDVPLTHFAFRCVNLVTNFFFSSFYDKLFPFFSLTNRHISDCSFWWWNSTFYSTRRYHDLCQSSIDENHQNERKQNKFSRLMFSMELCWPKINFIRSMSFFSILSSSDCVIACFCLAIDIFWWHRKEEKKNEEHKSHFDFDQTINYCHWCAITCKQRNGNTFFIHRKSLLMRLVCFYWLQSFIFLSSVF